VILATAVAVVPAAGVAALLVRRRRRRGDSAATAWRTSLAEVGLVLGTAPWLWMILTPAGSGRSIELVPLVGLATQVSHGTAVEQIGGNLLVFAAFGFCGRLRWGLPIRTVLGYAAAASLSVEILQYVLDIGRVSSVDDILLNTIGAGAAALAARVGAALAARNPPP
jgi:glycopeptide antibiotics resistance protein